MTWLQWVAFALGTAACLGIGVGAYRLATFSWNQVLQYRSPYVSSPAPEELRSVEPTPEPALVRTVVLVIVDGLREDVSRTSMPTLATLRGYGSDVSLTAPQPSLSFPNWTTILTGASPVISGVTTNNYFQRVIPPSLVDTVRGAGKRVVVVAPAEFGRLYGVGAESGVLLYQQAPERYLSTTLVDDTLRLSREATANLIVVHLPDVDNAGHAYGGASPQYRETASKVDAEIQRLVQALQSDHTTFVIVADHGHTDSGGHGGWEPSVVQVPGVFAGAGIRLGQSAGGLEQVAPTISVLLGLQNPAFAQGEALHAVIATDAPEVFANDTAHHIAFDSHYIATVTGATPTFPQLMAGGGPDANAAAVRDARLSAERRARLPMASGLLLVVLLIVTAIGLASWRALLGALGGLAVYYAIYEALFFGVHRYVWSLSAFNTAWYATSFMAWRGVEAALAALVGAGVAAAIYPLLRREAKGPQDVRYVAGYLALAPATLLMILGSLAVQVAYFFWLWGARVVWILPDLKGGVKAELDLAQMVAVGAAALLAPLVTYLIGRYHPRVTRQGG
jgi:hypothetical protein